MGATETVGALAAFEQRGAGTDTERRAALWLAGELASTPGEVRIETFWCRPNWALAHAWHTLLALAGSIVSVYSARVGGALLLVALMSVIADAFTGLSLGRRLTPERASQNVVAATPTQPSDRIRLILTANYDAGRMGLAYRGRLRALSARVRTLTGGFTPGWLGWLCIAISALLAIAILRLEGSHGQAIGAIQLVPTAALVITLATLLELASAGFTPGAGDNGSGVALAIALARALAAAPPQNVAVEVVLQGAGDVGATGLRNHLRARKRELRAAQTVVVGLAPCGDGQPSWWVSDGPLVPLRYFRRLRELCATVAAREPRLAAGPHKGRGTTPALPARARRLPAIALGCLDRRGIVPRSHRPEDTATAIDPAALDAAVQFGLMVIDELDGFLAARQRGVAVPA